MNWQHAVLLMKNEMEIQLKFVDGVHSIDANKDTLRFLNGT